MITKHGRPVAKLVAVDPPAPVSVFGCMADQTEFVGDLEPQAGAATETKRLDEERAAQWKAWEREWSDFGVIAGRRTSGPRGKAGKPRAGSKARLRPRA
ncbi:MAG TPA: hypothetical protein VI669_09975 [Vicinamibacteria bacterium]